MFFELGEYFLTKLVIKASKIKLNYLVAGQIFISLMFKSENENEFVNVLNCF